MKPVLQALLVADHVYHDAITGKKIVAGIFRKILLKKTVAQVNAGAGDETTMTLRVGPAGQRAGSPFCYVSLTDVHGEQPFELRYVHLGDDKVLISTKFKVASPGPLETVEIVIPLPQLPNKSGVFALELLWNDEPVGALRIIVENEEQE